MAVTPKYVTIKEGQTVVRDFTAGGAGNLGDCVYIASDGDVEVTDANAEATTRAVGIVVAVDDMLGATSFVAGDVVTVAISGPVYGFSSLTPNAKQWVSETAGEITETEPSGAGTFSYIVGYAESASVLIVQPSGVDVITNI